MEQHEKLFIMPTKSYRIGSWEWRESMKKLSKSSLMAGAEIYDRKLSKDDLIDIIEGKHNK